MSTTCPSGRTVVRQIQQAEKTLALHRMSFQPPARKLYFPRPERRSPTSSHHMARTQYPLRAFPPPVLNLTSNAAPTNTKTYLGPGAVPSSTAAMYSREPAPPHMRVPPSTRRRAGIERRPSPRAGEMTSSMPGPVVENTLHLRVADEQNPCSGGLFLAWMYRMHRSIGDHVRDKGQNARPAHGVGGNPMSGRRS